MVKLRFMLFILMVALGLSVFGCSQGQSPDPVPAAVEDAAEGVADGTSPSKRLVRWWRDDSIVAELGLSDDQLEAIDRLMTSKTGDSTEQRQQERQLGLRYLRALSQDPYDAAQVDHLSARLVEAVSEEHRRRIGSVRELRDILTQEQFSKLWDLAPRALQVGRFRATRGKTISISGDSAPPAALEP